MPPSTQLETVEDPTEPPGTYNVCASICTEMPKDKSKSGIKENSLYIGIHIVEIGTEPLPQPWPVKSQDVSPSGFRVFRIRRWLDINFPYENIVLHRWSNAITSDSGALRFLFLTRQCALLAQSAEPLALRF